MSILNRGYEEKCVEIEFVRSIIEYCVKCEVIPDIKYKIEYLYRRNIFGCEIDSYEYKKYSKRVVLPRIVNNREETLLEEVTRIHNIDVISLFEKYNVNELDGSIIASVLHEVGHMHLLYEDINRYGYGKRQREWEEDYIQNENGVLEYRLIREEKYADMFMIDFLDKHIEGILIDCKDYLTLEPKINIKCEESI